VAWPPILYGQHPDGNFYEAEYSVAETWMAATIHNSGFYLPSDWKDELEQRELALLKCV
jgi:hypothetical protein